jgi:hypothetical protein
VELEQWYIVQGTLYGYVNRKHGLNKALGPRFVECEPKAYDPETRTVEFTIVPMAGYSESTDTTGEAMQERRGRVRLVPAKLDKWFIKNKKEEKLQRFLLALPRPGAAGE